MKKKPPINILNESETIAILKFWIKENQWKEGEGDEMTAYYNGVANGCEFALMLLQRTGD